MIDKLSTEKYVREIEIIEKINELIEKINKLESAVIHIKLPDGKPDYSGMGF